jgi:4-hydroxy-tetrahydrodipicolinate synthase
VSIVGGFGAIYLLDELRRGSHGTMTGFAFPEILVAIWRAWQGGDRQTASEIYVRYLPLLVLEGQPKIGLAVRKELLKLRGFIASGLTRFPGPALDTNLRSDLEETLTLVDLRAPFEVFKLRPNRLDRTS